MMKRKILDRINQLDEKQLKHIEIELDVKTDDIKAYANVEVAMRALVGFSYYSAENLPPKFGDFKCLRAGPSSKPPTGAPHSDE